MKNVVLSLLLLSALNLTSCRSSKDKTVELDSGAFTIETHYLQDDNIDIVITTGENSIELGNIHLKLESTHDMDVVWEKNGKQRIGVLIFDDASHFNFEVLNERLSVYSYDNSKNFYDLFFNSNKNEITPKDNCERKMIELNTYSGF